MKKIFLTAALLAITFSSRAQDFDNKPTLNFQKAEAIFTIGARMMVDAAYYHSDFTKLKSGGSITDARIRTSFKYKDWYLYADFGFGGGKFSQKNIFAQWNHPDRRGGTSYVRAGYFGDPSSMARNTSLGSTHFMAMPGSVIALGVGRELGISYKYQNKRWFANQGIFTDHAYNDVADGFIGVSVSGRWLYRPINEEMQTLHIGVNGRFGHRGGGQMINNVLMRSLTLSQTLETFVDGKQDLVIAEMPWADNVINLGAEFLYRLPKFFVRGEFLYKHVTKERDSYAIYKEDDYDWGSYEKWLLAHPLRDNNFFGGYIELGYRLFGNPYTYNEADGVLGGFSGKSLEFVARYNYTGLNDIVDGEYYSVEQDRYYPLGYDESLPFSSSSVGGGNVHAFTVGVNFSFNKYVQVMCDYTYTRLDRDRFPRDRDFNCLQGRVMFTF